MQVSSVEEPSYIVVAKRSTYTLAMFVSSIVDEDVAAVLLHRSRMPN